MGRLRIVFATLFITASCFVNIAYSEKVLPNFAGFWFNGRVTLGAVDSCGKSYFMYEDRASGKAELANSIFRNLPVEPKCRWSKPYFFEFEDTPEFMLPADFPADEEDFQQLMENPANPRPEVWAVDCRNDKGSMEDRRMTDIYPSYQCPANSRIYFDKQNWLAYCSTSPAVCYADVVGRDLNVPELEKLGHVGLTTLTNSGEELKDNYVLEVLNNAEVINLNTLRSFERSEPTNYWGEVYAVDKSRQLVYVDNYEAKQAIQAGIEQKQFCPKYTMGAAWQEGRYKTTQIFDATTQSWIQQDDIIPAIFRCDTFVNYCYSKGFALSIPISPFILPLSTYNSFFYQRLDVPPQTYNSLLPKTVNSIPVVQQEQLDQLISHVDGANFGVVDAALTAYMSSPSIPRTDKLNYLWQQAQRHSAKTILYGYFMDSLSAIRAAELIPEFVKSFAEQTVISNKAKLLSAIARAIEPPNPDDPKLKEVSSAVDKSVLAQNSIIAQQFILQELQQEKNAQLLRYAIDFSSSVLPMNQQNYQLVVSAMQRLDTLSDTEWRLNMDQKNFLLLAMAFATPAMQTTILPQLLTQSRNSEEKNSFDSQLTTLLRYVPAAHINSSIKGQLNDYLGQMTPNAANVRLSEVQALNSVNQLYAQAIVNAANPKQKMEFIRNKILAMTDPLQQARLLSVMDKATLQMFTATELRKLVQELNDNFRHSARAREKMIYASAIDALNQILKIKEFR